MDKAMNIETSTVTKLLITGAESLDPISVYLEDFAPCKGKITVSCFDKTWHAHWGGMWDVVEIATGAKQGFAFSYRTAMRFVDAMEAGAASKQGGLQ
ncbi:hypothetical protein D3C80_583300 [compost metagenome]